MSFKTYNDINEAKKKKKSRISNLFWLIYSSVPYLLKHQEKVSFFINSKIPENIRNIIFFVDPFKKDLNNLNYIFYSFASLIIFSIIFFIMFYFTTFITEEKEKRKQLYSEYFISTFITKIVLYPGMVYYVKRFTIYTNYFLALLIGILIVSAVDLIVTYLKKYYNKRDINSDYTKYINVTKRF